MAVRVLLAVAVNVRGVLVRVNDGVNLGAGYGYDPFDNGVADLLVVGIVLGVGVLVDVRVTVGVRDRVGDR